MGGRSQILLTAAWEIVATGRNRNTIFCVLSWLGQDRAPHWAEQRQKKSVAKKKEDLCTIGVHRSKLVWQTVWPRAFAEGSATKDTHGRPHKTPAMHVGIFCDR